MVRNKLTESQGFLKKKMFKGKGKERFNCCNMIVIMKSRNPPFPKI